MFTGIIEEVGRIAAAEELGGGRRFTIGAGFAGELQVDESVAVQGACLTVVERDATSFQVEAVEETLAKTSLGRLAVGHQVNLERAMKLGQRLDGHIVQGHVDATGTVVGAETKENSWLYRIAYDADFAPYLIPVGSVAVDGISLTVARLENDHFTVSIIPHTYEHTTVADWAEGTVVNLEFDMLGKYVVRFLSRGSGGGRPESV